MKLKRTHLTGGALIVLGATGGWWLLRQPPDRTDRSDRSDPSVSAAQPLHPATAALTRYATPGTDPRDDLRAIDAVLDTFRLLAKGDSLPLGSNEEISAALRGETRAMLTLLPRDHPAFDANGRLVDRWGTPLFFHALSAQDIEIRSAGPDLQMDTADDMLHSARQHSPPGVSPSPPPPPHSPAAEK